MQVTVKDIKVKTGIVKSGKNEGNPWKLIIITGEDGTEFTTFDDGAQEVGVGGIIELEPIIKAGKINFTEFKIIQKGASLGTVAKSNGDRPSMTPEMWAEKDRLDRHSKECNTAFMGIMQLAATSELKLQPELALKFTQTFDHALDWAMAHLEKPSVAARAYQPPKPAENKVAKTLADNKGFDNAGQFLTACRDNKGMNRSDVLVALSISDVSEIKDFNQAYKELPEAKGSIK